MKRSKVKGFTLIELIVVIAIFGIIMFGALQLIPPIMKMMVQADVHEDGNAAVSSISGTLENRLSTAEYLIAYNSLPQTDTFGTNEIKLKDTAIVEQFVQEYYEGVLQAGTEVDATTKKVKNPKYASGKVHVLLIDNRVGGVTDSNGDTPAESGNGKISEIIYDVSSFDIGITDADITYSSSQEYVVNKAYYDNYRYEIMCGVYDDSDFNLADPVSYNDFITNLSTRSTVFSIRAITRRNNTDYSFVTNAALSLTNIYRRGGDGVSDIYYVVNESYNPITKNVEHEIVDYTKGGTASGALSTNGTFQYIDGINPPENYTFTDSRSNGIVDSGKLVRYKDNCVDGYCFIYSYGSEINTQKP